MPPTRSACGGTGSIVETPTIDPDDTNCHDENSQENDCLIKESRQNLPVKNRWSAVIADGFDLAMKVEVGMAPNSRTKLKS